MNSEKDDRSTGSVQRPALASKHRADLALGQADLGSSLSSALSRQVIGLFGLPIDISDTQTVLDRMYRAIEARSPFFLSTVNVNFLVSSLTDSEFRRTLVASDLCTVDGAPIIWIARCLGVRIRERVAGSDLFEHMKRSSRRPATKIFLFGGERSVADRAATAMNAQSCGVFCVGTHYPGFGSVEEMSTPEIIEKINRSHADLVAAALGAKKGQAWLYRNRDRFHVPVRVHLGATLNFQAGSVRRAPVLFQRFGFEWLWRILQEPKLWSRYAYDGLVLVRLFLTRVLPLAVILTRRHVNDAALSIRPSKERNHAVEAAGGRANRLSLELAGHAIGSQVHRIEPWLRTVAQSRCGLTLDMAGVTILDLRFLGTLTCLREAMDRAGLRLELTNVSKAAARVISLSGFEYLLC